MNNQDTGKLLLVGVLVGGVSGLLAYLAIAATIDQKLADGTKDMKRQVDAQLPPLVGKAIDDQLKEYGITRATGQRIDRLLSLVSSTGII